MNGAVDVLLAPDVRPFAVTGVIVAALACIESLSTAIGFSIGHIIGKDFRFHDHRDGTLAWLIVWLNPGRAPLLVVILLLLGIFSIEGFLIQALARELGGPLPTYVAAFAALVGTIPVVRLSSRGIAQAIPRDESYAIREEDLVGRVAIVTVGPLDQGLPGRIRVKDGFGNWHTAPARASSESRELPIGENVLLVALDEKGFVAIAAPPELLDS